LKLNGQEDFFNLTKSFN